MANLATIADIEDRLGRALADEDERVRVEALLRDASAAVRAYTGQQWKTGATTAKVRPRLDFVSFKGITSVTSIVNTATGNDVPYQWDGMDRIYLWPPAYRYSIDYDFVAMPSVVTVSYVADDPPPDEVLAVTCQMVLRASGVDPQSSGHQQESIAGYSYSVGIAAASAGVGMLPDERRVLDSYRALGRSIWVGTQ